MDKFNMGGLLFAVRYQKLFTAVIGDALDQIELTRQFLRAGIAPRDPAP